MILKFFTIQKVIHNRSLCICAAVSRLLPTQLSHWDQDKMDAIFQTTFSNAFSWMKIYEFRLSEPTLVSLLTHICVTRPQWVKTRHRIFWINAKAERIWIIFQTHTKHPTPDNKVHGANMGPIWGRQDPGGPHVGPMNLAIWDILL